MGDELQLVSMDQSPDKPVLVGSNSNNCLNIHGVGNLQVHGTFCGQQWDSKHCILGVIVVLSITVMITTLAVVVTKCSQKVYVVSSPDHNQDKFHLRMTFPPKWSDGFLKNTLYLPTPGNYSIHFRLRNQTKIAKIYIDTTNFHNDTENIVAYSMYCTPTNISWPCTKVCEGDCDYYYFNTSHPIHFQYKLDDNCLRSGGDMELTEI